MRPHIAGAAVVAAASLLRFTPVLAHGVVGARFFPATLTTDDPFAADELALPTISSFKHLDGSTPLTETDYSFEYAKTLWRGVAVGIDDAYVHTTPQGAPSVNGFDNIGLSLRAEIVRSAAHEFIASAGIGWDIGGTGSKAIGDARSSFTPSVNIGKGFGDLPDSMALLRPFAITAGIGYGIPGYHSEPHTLEWGGALEYSLAYLQTNVRNVGLGPVLSHVTPLVEFSLSSPLDRHGGKATGTIDPGLIWSGQKVQLGAELVVPVNSATGSHVGFITQLHFYIDDIFPHTLGRPLFGD